MGLFDIGAFGFELLVCSAITGIVIGFFLGVFGGGGSILATPLIIYLVGLSDPHLAIGTSAATVALTALVNLLMAHSRDSFAWGPAVFFAGVGVVGAGLGSSLAKSIDGQQLLFAFSMAMLVVAGAMFVRKPQGHCPRVTLSPAVARRLAPAGLSVGAVSGFFGIGGGFLIVPALVLSTGMSLLQATTSSLLAIFSFGVTTAVNYALDDLVVWPVALLIVAFGVAGAYLGRRAVIYLDQRQKLASRLFAIFLCLVAVYIAVQTV